MRLQWALQIGRRWCDHRPTTTHSGVSCQGYAKGAAPATERCGLDGAPKAELAIYGSGRFRFLQIGRLTPESRRSSTRCVVSGAGPLGYTRASRAAGFHTFRHSAATIVNERTGDLKLVQNLLGHSNLSTTADVYTHTSTEGERGAAQALEQAIFGNLFQTVPQTWNGNRSAGTN